MVANVARLAEEAGWDGLFIWDHMIGYNRTGSVTSRRLTPLPCPICASLYSSSASRHIALPVAVDVEPPHLGPSTGRFLTGRVHHPDAPRSG